MASFINMNLNTKSKIYNGLNGKKFIKAPANLRIKLTSCFFTTTNNTYLLITSGVGVGVQQTKQWRPSSIHLCVSIQCLYKV